MVVESSSLEHRAMVLDAVLQGIELRVAVNGSVPVRLPDREPWAYLTFRPAGLASVSAPDLEPALAG
jgi:hypothetical protein